MALTTKDKLSEQVLNELNKRNIDSNFKEGDVILRVQQTLAWFIRQRFFQSKADDVSDVDGSYFFTFKNQPVLKDEDMNHYYVSLPGTSIDLPHGAGIGKVAPMKDQNNGYKLVSYGFDDLYKGLAASTLENSIGVYPIGDTDKGAKLVFVNMNGSNNPDKVLITMVVPFDGIGDDVVLNIPMDIQREVIDTIVGYFAGAPQKDNTNDRVDQV
jgi:hypothetical protein